MCVYDAMAKMPFVDINTQIFGSIMQQKVRENFPAIMFNL